MFPSVANRPSPHVPSVSLYKSSYVNPRQPRSRGSFIEKSRSSESLSSREKGRRVTRTPNEYPNL